MNDGLNRRSLLRGAATVYLISAMSTFAPIQMAAAAPTTFSGVHFGRTLIRFRSDLNDPTPWICPAAVRLDQARKAPAMSQLVWTWDSRLAGTSPRVVLATPSGTTEVDGEITTTGDTASLSVPVASVNGLLGAGLECLLLPAFQESPAISEVALGLAVETLVVVRTPDGAPIQMVESSPVAPTPPESVWAASLSVLWDGADGATSAAGYSYPSQVLIASGGPNPIPAGTTVLMTTAGGAAKSLSLLSCESEPGVAHPTESQPTQANGATQCRVRLLAPIPAGRSVTLRLEADLIPNFSVTAESRALALVSVIGPNSPASLQRQTGSETVTILS